MMVDADAVEAAVDVAMALLDPVVGTRFGGIGLALVVGGLLCWLLWWWWLAPLAMAL